MQIKTIMRYHLPLFRRDIIKKNIESKWRDWWGCGAKETLVHCCWDCKLVRPPRNSIEVLQKTQPPRGAPTAAQPVKNFPMPKALKKGSFIHQSVSQREALSWHLPSCPQLAAIAPTSWSTRIHRVRSASYPSSLCTIFTIRLNSFIFCKCVKWSRLNRIPARSLPFVCFYIFSCREKKRMAFQPTRRRLCLTWARSWGMLHTQKSPSSVCAFVWAGGWCISNWAKATAGWRLSFTHWVAGATLKEKKRSIGPLPPAPRKSEP